MRTEYSCHLLKDFFLPAYISPFPYKENERRVFEKSKVAILFLLSVQKWASFKKELAGDELHLLQNHFQKIILSSISQGYSNK